MKEFEFRNKIINENYRPEFKVPIKKSLKNLIEQCWSNEPEDRPTFADIFEKLSVNNVIVNEEEEKVDEKSENFFDEIDDEELKSYLDLIKKYEDENKNETDIKHNGNEVNYNELLSLKETIDNLKIENRLMKENLTINSFNCFPLKIQQSIISDFISWNLIDEKKSVFQMF